MENASKRSLRAQVLIVLALVLLLRIPFLNQAIQGDDYYYLSGAMHAQIDPLHPTHGRYVFAGKLVDVRGHPHPPLDMWVLGALLALFGDIREVPFHAAYILFSLIAAWSMLALARRFSSRPMAATLLFLAVPAFVVNGGSLESDVPFLAFWMLAMALFIRAVDRRSLAWLAAACCAAVPAALAAYQSVLLMPILAVYLFLHRRRWAAGWIALLAPAFVLGLWQLFERITGGALPAGVLAGYFESYGLQQLTSKLDNAVAMTVHTGWIVFPLLAVAAFRKIPRWGWGVIGVATVAAAVRLDPHPLFWVTFAAGLLTIGWCVAALLDRRDTDRFFLAAWVLLFFAAALVLFFAGSARYLLPVAAPLCLLVTAPLAARPSWLYAGFGLQMALALALAVVNYQHWDGYRRYVDGLSGEFAERRVWVNGEWGLRFYAEERGGLPLQFNQPVQPGDLVLTSEIAYPIEYTTGGGVRTTLKDAEISSVFPLRLIGLNARSAYSTVTLGYRPFDLVRGPIDRVHGEVIIARQPELSNLPMNAPAAESQIVSGVYKLEDNAWRWMAQRGVILLKAPPEPAPLAVQLYIPEQSPARRVRVSVDGQVVAEEELPGPGMHTVRTSAPVTVAGADATIEIVADQNFAPPGDNRQLSLILSSVGFE